MPNISRKNASQPVAAIDSPLSMRDLATVLVKHYGLHEGVYDLMLEFQIGTGPVGPDATSLSPGVMIGFSKIGLMPSINTGPTTVDAAIVNPEKKSRKKTAP